MPSYKVRKIIDIILENRKNRKINKIKKKWERISELSLNHGKIVLLAFLANMDFKDLLYIVSKFKEENNDFYKELIKLETKRMERLYKTFIKR